MTDSPVSDNPVIENSGYRPHPPKQMVGGLAALMAAVVTVSMMLLGGRTAPQPAHWGYLALMVVLMVAAEQATSSVRMGSHRVNFSMSEVVFGLLLLWFSPPLALFARVIAVLIYNLAFIRNTGFKVVANTLLSAFELALVTVGFYAITDLFGQSPTALVLATLLSVLFLSPFGAIVAVFAVLRSETEYRPRLRTWFAATSWLYGVNASLAAMAVGLDLLSPALSILALAPMAALWWVIRAQGHLQSQVQELTSSYGFVGRISRRVDADSVLQAGLYEGAAQFHTDRAAFVLLANREQPEFHQTAELGFTLQRLLHLPAWQTVIEGDVAVQVSGSDLAAYGISPRTNIGEVLLAPVKDAEGVIGLFVIVLDPGALLGDSSRDRPGPAKLGHLSEQLGISLRRGMLHDQMEHEANHDHLTGLIARNRFMDHVQEALDPSSTDRAWILMLDLDRFKEVNDTLGHHAGDKLLVTFAERLVAAAGSRNVISRLAGDEFAVLVTNATEVEVERLARQIVEAASVPVLLEETEVVISVSIGVADVVPGPGAGAALALRHADIAMYNAKFQRSGVEFYRAEIDRRKPGRLSMLGDLRAAIETNAIAVVFQPKLDLVSGKIVGAEALARWEHPERGRVSPAEFVRVAEDTGLITDLTNRVLATAIKAAGVLRENGYALDIAVNLSTQDLFDAKLSGRIRSYLEQWEVPASSLVLEITESSLFVDVPRTRSTIDDLDGVGMPMSIDDFGTGYSSLSVLRQVPVDEVKIDRSFVANMLYEAQDAVIVKSTIELGHNLGLQVVAEGVQDPAVIDRLRSMGCDLAQGFCISHPLSLPGLMGWLDELTAVPDDPSRPWVTGVGRVCPEH